MQPHRLSLLWPTILTCGLAACSSASTADPRTQPPLVRAASVQTSATATRAFTGTVAARIQSDLGFRVPGQVTARLVDVGQRVRRGQTLLRLDPADLRLAVQAQQEAVAAARAKAQQTAEDETRFRSLRGTGAIAAATYDQIHAAAEAAQAQLKAAEAQASVAQNGSRYTELVADADGIVMATMAETGQVVAAGQPVIRLAHAGQREAIVQLPETVRPSIGSSAAAEVFGEVPQLASATLRQLSEAADPATRTFEARYVLTGAAAQAPLGSTVTVTLADPRGTRTDAVRVPLAAVFDAGAGAGVWIIHGQPASISRRAVRVLRIDDETATVTGDLPSGTQIVALGASLLREGALVRVAGQRTPSSTTGTKP